MTSITMVSRCAASKALTLGAVAGPGWAGMAGMPQGRALPAGEHKRRQPELRIEAKRHADAR
jgi:hypothetical protein